MTENGWVGKTIGGRYEIKELLGKGGMSAVYKAHDPNLKRPVAVKMIHPHLSHNPEFVSRFEEEAAAVAKLRHPNIVQVYDFNHDGDLFYMVLEFVEGETLFDWLEHLNETGKRLEIKNAIQYAMNVCEAADYAHQKMMYHRDIKPANVMITPQNQAVLMDFGIAKIVGGQVHTAAGTVIGTAKYMAPEQIRGEKADHRADIYSIGVMFFEMLNGRAPFDADSAMSLMMKHLKDPVPNLQELQPDVPDNLGKVISKALEKDREKRYQTAGEMANALKKALIQYEHKEASLFKTVQITQDELAEMTGATAKLPTHNLPEEVEGTDSGKTRIISMETEPDEYGKTMVVASVGSLEEAKQSDQVQDKAGVEGDVMKTVKMTYEEVKEGAKSSAEMAGGATMVMGESPAVQRGGSQPAQASEPRKRSKRPLLMIGVIAAVFAIAVILGAAFVMFGGSQAKPTAQASVTFTALAFGINPTATSQPAATQTPLPTTAENPTQALAETEAPQAPGATEEVTVEPPAGSENGNPNASQPGEYYFQVGFDNLEALSALQIFADNSAGNKYSADMVDGQLELNIAKEQASLYALYDLVLANPDVRVETVASKVAGPNSNEIGAICRYTDQGFYYLAYTSSGNWYIYRYQFGLGDNSWTTITSGTSNAIQLTNATNQLTATCAGAQLTLSVNGTDLGSADDSTFADGGLAGVAIWGKFPGLGVNFDYIYASVP